MKKKTVRDIDVSGKRVLVRVDFNVPRDKATGAILDDLRIRAALPTIDYLREQGARAILCSHLGRPKGEVNESLRLTPVAQRLGEIIGKQVVATRDCVGPEVAEAVENMQPGDVLLLENLRFHPEEEANDPEFSRQLASLADVYVNDAFGTAHRAHASTAGVARDLPAVAGFLMEKEIDYLDKAVNNPERPLGAIIGGAKISDKIEVLKNLLQKADVVIVGGGMANTFLRAQGVSMGASLVEEDKLDTARAIMDEAASRGKPLLLPTDVVIAEKFDADSAHGTAPVNMVLDGWMVLDVGERSVDKYIEALSDCRTIVWNGPLGVTEFPVFAQGSLKLAKALAAMNATTIVGGGETVALIKQSGLSDKFSHVSTGGGASLEFLEGKTLPGVAVLQDK